MAPRRPVSGRAHGRASASCVDGIHAGGVRTTLISITRRISRTMSREPPTNVTRTTSAEPMVTAVRWREGCCTVCKCLRCNAVAVRRSARHGSAGLRSRRTK
eukprot:2254378-Prymnesium_polylepis.2